MPTPKELSGAWNKDGLFVILMCSNYEQHVADGSCAWDLGPSATTERLFWVTDESGHRVPDDAGADLRAPESKRGHAIWARAGMIQACQQLVMDRTEVAKQAAEAKAAQDALDASEAVRLAAAEAELLAPEEEKP